MRQLPSYQIPRHYLQQVKVGVSSGHREMPKANSAFALSCSPDVEGSSLAFKSWRELNRQRTPRTLSNHALLMSTTSTGATAFRMLPHTKWN